MTEEQATLLLSKMDDLIFVARAAVCGIGLCWGAISWRLVILAKNQRRIW